jgi:hypothetical protein
MLVELKATMNKDGIPEIEISADKCTSEDINYLYICLGHSIYECINEGKTQDDE